MRRGVLGTLVGALSLAVVPVAGARLLAASTTVHVSPGSGGVHTSFRLRFAIPEATGASQDLYRRDSVIVSGPSRKGCVGQAEIGLRAAAARHVFNVTLNPERLNGHWCDGTFNGRLVQTETVVCSPGPVQAGIMCPDIVIAPQTLARFSFTVVGPG